MDCLRLWISRGLTIVVWATIIFFMIIIHLEWITCLPQPHRTIVFDAAEQCSDPTSFLHHSVESGFQLVPAHRWGAVMQIMPETMAGLPNRDQAVRYHRPARAQINIEMGCWYLASLNREFAGSLPMVVAAYNAGSGRVREWASSGKWDGSEQHLEDIPFPETRQYVKRVLQNYKAYQAIYK